MSKINKPVYRDIPSTFNFDHILKVSVAHHLETELGHWIHMSVVADESVPDPRNLSEDTVTMTKEHSVLIFNPDLQKIVDLNTVPLDQLVSKGDDMPVLMRTHSLCRFGDSFGSLKCDCGPQLFAARRNILERGAGVIIYTEQEGRNAGLTGKAAFYRLSEVEQMPTSKTFTAVGLHKNDLRNYDVVVEIAQLLSIDNIEMLSNNPNKIAPFEDAGINIIRSPLEIPATQESASYLEDKRDSMGHMLEGQQENPHAEVACHLRTLMPHLRIHHLEYLSEMIKGELEEQEASLVLTASTNSAPHYDVDKIQTNKVIRQKL